MAGHHDSYAIRSTLKASAHPCIQPSIPGTRFAPTGPQALDDVPPEVAAVLSKRRRPSTDIMLVDDDDDDDNDGSASSSSEDTRDEAYEALHKIMAEEERKKFSAAAAGKWLAMAAGGSWWGWGPARGRGRRAVPPRLVLPTSCQWHCTSHVTHACPLRGRADVPGQKKSDSVASHTLLAAIRDF